MPFTRPVAARTLREASGFFRRLGSFLATSDSVDRARLRLEHQMERREQTFIGLLERSVFANPASPYKRLFNWADITLPDIVGLLASDGLSRTLERLYDAGVHVTLEEFKGRRPIVRTGLEIPVESSDFDNPVATTEYDASTSGSTGPAKRIPLGLDLLEHEAAYHHFLQKAAGLSARPLGLWHLAPPGSVGIKAALIYARLGNPVERWFSPNGTFEAAFKHGVFTRAAVLAAELGGTRIPVPELTTARQAGRIAAWLAEKRADGTAAILMTTPSGAVRTVVAAMNARLDIAGTCFVVAGEPCTAAKVRVLAQNGCRVLSYYGMVEAGLLGMPCLSARQPDDVHLLGDKVATIDRNHAMGGRTVISALYHTTLLPTSPKVMINVESGDSGTRERRVCGCGVLPSCFTDHVHTIRGYDKLTSEGMHVLGGDLLQLVEEFLPARFGGFPTDYQFVEREQSGLSRVRLIVRRPLADAERTPMTQAVIEFLRSRGQSQRLVAGIWARAETLEVVHGEPFTTVTGKIPPLRTLQE